MPGDLARPLSSALQTIVKLARVAVLVKDEDGYYILTNQAAETMLGCPTGELLGKHMVDICPADPRLVMMAFGRLKQDGAWAGEFPLRHPAGIIQVNCHSFAHDNEDGGTSYVDLISPVRQYSHDRPAAGPADLTAFDLCLLQLMVEGYTDDHLAVLFGTSVERAREQVRRTMARMRATSRTEACIKAIKQHLVN